MNTEGMVKAAPEEKVQKVPYERAEIEFIEFDTTLMRGSGDEIPGGDDDH